MWLIETVLEQSVCKYGYIRENGRYFPQLLPRDFERWRVLEIGNRLDGRLGFPKMLQRKISPCAIGLFTG